MPTVEENVRTWNVEYDWSQEGEEWSAQFGGTEAIWWGALFPRLKEFLPTTTILEIGPGFGRWTRYLKNHCDHLILVDIADRCIDACRRRFVDARNISYFTNDGSSLDMVPDNSVDFVFSFDSLVHAEEEVLHRYLEELRRKLKPQGAGLIHHSNLDMYAGILKASQMVPGPLREVLRKGRIIPNYNCWRAKSVSAEVFRSLCVRSGFECVVQELIGWKSGAYLIDCISLFSQPRVNQLGNGQLVRNRHFHHEASRLAPVLKFYSR